MKVTFLPLNITIETTKQITILELMKKANIPIDTPCNGLRICGKCKIKVIKGKFLPIQLSERKLLSSKELSKNIRLACCLYPISDCVILLETVKENREKEPIHKVIFHKDIIYGIAVDIGTTSMAAQLWDLSNGVCLMNTSKRNPQCRIGADIISRISYCLEKEEERIGQLQQMLFNAINEMISDFIQDNSKEYIKKVVIVGNTAMSHMLQGLSVKGLSRYPIKLLPNKDTIVFNKVLRISEEAEVIILPNMGGYVGSDIMADILLEKLYCRRGNYILVDIGTNGEIVLSKNNKIYITSAAAGPTFEGYAIKCGMRAEIGAIHKVKLKGKEIQFSVIGNVSPVGFCGSGLIDAIAVLRKLGIIEESGRIITREEAKELYIEESIIFNILEKEERAYLFYSDLNIDIILTQEDIRQFQLAKAAIFAGIHILLQKAEISLENVDQLIITGAFGNFITIESAQLIGLLPDILPYKVVSIENGALLGAAKVLVDNSLVKIASHIIDAVTVVELSNTEQFNLDYMKSINFPYII